MDESVSSFWVHLNLFTFFLIMFEENLWNVSLFRWQAMKQIFKFRPFVNFYFCDMIEFNQSYSMKAFLALCAFTLFAFIVIVIEENIKRLSLCPLETVKHIFKFSPFCQFVVLWWTNKSYAHILYGWKQV